MVERDHRFVGALERGVMARALLRNQRTQIPAGYDDVLANVAAGYWLGVSGLIQVVVDMLPVAAPLPHGAKHERSHWRQ